MGELASAYPRLKVVLELDDRLVDLVGEGFDMANQHDETMLQSRSKLGQGYCGRHFIVGHTSSTKNPITISGRTDLDTQAYETGRLAIVIFDDNVPGGPYGFLHVQGASGARRVILDAVLE